MVNDGNRKVGAISLRSKNMTLSVFDIFKVGIGPSSSHTVGPMWAGVRFLEELRSKGIIDHVTSVRVGLYGSLALTGVGHGTDKATILGLAGYQPDLIDPDTADKVFEAVKADEVLHFAGERDIPFDYDTQMVFHMGETLPEHPNGMRIFASDADGIVVYYKTYLSIGGGFILSSDEMSANKKGGGTKAGPGAKIVPYPFDSGDDILKFCTEYDISISEMMYANEMVLHQCGKEEVDARLDSIWGVMEACVNRGLKQQGVMPVSGIKRRAADIYQSLLVQPETMLSDPFAALDWVAVFAVSVNEENACGGRVVTAPTNGAAGVIPAVIAYYKRFLPGADQQGIREFLLTAGAIGMLYKKNASISGAEVGCQGEVGVACSMAAAGLAAVKGAIVPQIENAAEIGMEHHLGMTCDPINGLVQIPCIERNSMGAMKSITAARIAMRGDGSHVVSLDEVIETMYRTGMDMQAKYKETSTGGLAVFASGLAEC
jgi:L-serine dehydratase